jgi:hypothetical protein
LKKLTPKQIQWLRDVRDRKNPLDRFNGRSQNGGATIIHASLMKRGLIEFNMIGVVLTDAGKAALLEAKGGAL